MKFFTLFGFLLHHWVMLAVIAGIIVFIVLEPAMSAIFLRRFWKPILVIVAFVLLALFFEWRGAVGQSAADAPVIAGLKADAEAAKAAKAVSERNAAKYAADLKTVQDQLTADAAERDRLAQAALEAQSAATLAAARADSALQGWRSKYRHAPEACHVIPDPNTCKEAIDGL